MAERIGRSLERSGLITRDLDLENAWLAFDPSEEAAIHGLLGHSITYRVATGPREGQKVFTLQTIRASPEGPRREVAEASGNTVRRYLRQDGKPRYRRRAARPTKVDPFKDKRKAGMAGKNTR